MSKLWTVRLKATEEQRDRITAAAFRSKKSIGDWLLEVGDTAAISMGMWTPCWFDLLIPSNNMHEGLKKLQSMEARFDTGIKGLGRIDRFESQTTPEGLSVSYQTTTSMTDLEQLEPLIQFHVGDLGVRVTACGGIE